MSSSQLPLPFTTGEMHARLDSLPSGSSLGFPRRLVPSIPQEDLATLQRAKHISSREITASWCEPIYHLIQAIFDIYGYSIFHTPLRLSLCAFITNFTSAANIPTGYRALAKEAILGRILHRPFEEDALALAIMAATDPQNAEEYISSFLEIAESLWIKAGHPLQHSKFRGYLVTIMDHLLRTLHEPDNLPPTTRHYLEARIFETTHQAFGLEACRRYEDYRPTESKDFLSLFNHCFIVLRKLVYGRLQIPVFDGFNSLGPDNSRILRFVDECLKETPSSALQHSIEREFGKAAGTILNGQDPDAEWGRILATFVSLLYRQFCGSLVAVLDKPSTSAGVDHSLYDFLEYVRRVFDRFSDGSAVLDKACYRYNIPSYTGGFSPHFKTLTCGQMIP